MQLRKTKRDEVLPPEPATAADLESFRKFFSLKCLNFIEKKRKSMKFVYFRVQSLKIHVNPLKSGLKVLEFI